MPQPMPPEAASPAEAAPQEGGFGEFAANLAEGLSMGVQMFSEVSPEAAQLAGQAQELWMQAVELASGGGKPPQQPGGMAPEQAGVSGAKPAGPTY